MGTAIVHLLDPPPALGAVEAWLARRPPVLGLCWLAFADPDGAVGLVPSGPGGEACPALLVLEQAGGCGVTVCDPAIPRSSAHSPRSRTRCAASAAGWRAGRPRPAVSSACGDQDNSLDSAMFHDMA